MDYYEELGLSRTASVDEIRQAYRQFARLIHPDQQPDDGLRRLAETQMKRLNMILETLADPVRRREYDRSSESRGSLVHIPQPHAPSTKPRIFAQMAQVRRDVWVWVGAALIGIVAISVFFGHYAATGPDRIINTGGHTARASEMRDESASSRHPQKSRTRVKPIATESFAYPSPPLQTPAPTAPDRTIGQRTEPRELPADSAALLPEPQITVEIPENAPQLPNPTLNPFRPAAKPGFGGSWIYVPQAEPTDKHGSYPPEYIEVKIAEKDGQLWGLYRARYLVTDRAIPPSVTFHFEGRVAGPLSTWRWEGSGGAYGRVTLKLISENSLEVIWTANKLSGELGLIAGAAKLVRQREP